MNDVILTNESMKRSRADLCSDSNQDISDVRNVHGRLNGILCNEPPCRDNFIRLEFYSSHVENNHNNVCGQCSQNFITERILELHFDECHNPFNCMNSSLKCFEPQCQERFETHKERIQHLISNHGYPRFYDFDVIFSGY